MNVLKSKFRPYYILRPRLWAENVQPIDRRTAVSHKWQYAYIRIPKAANTTMVYALQEHFPDILRTGGKGREIKDQYRNFSDLSLLQSLRLSREYFVFTVVRNPYHRALSGYLNKIKLAPSIRPKYRNKIEHYDNGRTSFRGFCRYLAEGGEGQNAHWIRQTRFLGLSDKLDYIGHIESLQDDLSEIIRRIGGTGKEIPPLSRKGPAATGATDKAHSYYDEETRQIVEHVYAEDFRYLGYAVGKL